MSELPYLHNHPSFADLLQIIAAEMGIDPSLVEKDYWIMHCIYGLQQTGLEFELKGGTSLSKAFGVIHRFSEDIDLHIAPPDHLEVKTHRNQTKPAHNQSRKDYYDWLVANLRLPDIDDIRRDEEFDQPRYFSGGIRLNYPEANPVAKGVKQGILLELGFDLVAPNTPVTISSWAYKRARGAVDVIDNRALDVLCYLPGYTFVEKLQAIATKYRKWQTGGVLPPNYMRHYYDVYCLLEVDEVVQFIGTQEYLDHKELRFPEQDKMPIEKNQAFILDDPAARKVFEKEYEKTKSLYYQGQPAFNEILDRLHGFLGQL